MRNESERICDRCLSEAKVSDRDFLYQEFLCIDWTFGYGAIDHDGDKYELDLCLECIKDILLPHARKVGSLF